MEKFDIQVLLKDGAIADYQVENERGSDTYEVYFEEKPVAAFKAMPNGSWQVSNDAQLDEDLKQRIINQLNGFKG